MSWGWVMPAIQTGVGAYNAYNNANNSNQSSNQDLQLNSGTTNLFENWNTNSTNKAPSTDTGNTGASGSWTDVFSDTSFWSGMMTAGAGLAGGLLQEDIRSENNAQNIALERERMANSREVAMAQIAASSANASAAVAAQKEIAKKQIAARLAGDYGSYLHKSSMSRAEALKNRDVMIPQNISAMFARIGGGK